MFKDNPETTDDRGESLDGRDEVADEVMDEGAAEPNLGNSLARAELLVGVEAGHVEGCVNCIEPRRVSTL